MSFNLLSNLLRFICILLIIISCNTNKAQKTENNNLSEKSTETSLVEKQITKTNLEEILEKQLNIGYSQLYDESYDISDYKYSQKDLEVIIPFLKRNINPVSTKVFKERIQKIFGRTILPKSEKKYLTVNFSDPCDRNISFYRNDNAIDIKPFSIQIIKQANFITELYAIPEIIDYEKQYPELAEEEKSSNNKRVSSDGTTVEIYKWKDIEDLKSNRDLNLKLFIARNQYLFNDDKKHFEWLIKNDEAFMKNLISKFSYLDDNQLTDWYIEKFRFEIVNGNTNGKEYGRLLWHKDCNNNFIFHSSILDKMKKNDSYIDDLNNYVDFLMKNNKGFEYLSFKNQAYLIANIYHFIQNQTSNTFDYMGFFAEFYDTNNIYSNEFEKNDYYKLNNFKDQWLEAKKVGNGISR
ncbi:hypothetical protein ABMY20_11950 [Tenacibaculum sp. SSH1-16]|uniref:hypothetical protein n=1 Tax=Tenacibaculum TaxID=104267 RepID=UPI0006497C92|nr:hypothetical protein [Tenacibaculum mesophilum]